MKPEIQKRLISEGDRRATEGDQRRWLYRRCPPRRAKRQAPNAGMRSTSEKVNEVKPAYDSAGIQDPSDGLAAERFKRLNLFTPRLHAPSSQLQGASSC